MPRPLASRFALLVIAALFAGCGPAPPPPETPAERAARARADKVNAEEDAQKRNASTCFNLYKTLAGDITTATKNIEAMPVTTPEELAAAHDVWRALDINKKIPETCTYIARKDDPDLTPVYDRHDETLKSNTEKLRGGLASQQLSTFQPLISKAIEGGFPEAAIPVLFDVYLENDPKVLDGERRVLAQQLATAIDEQHLAMFKKSRAYGKRERRGGDVMCLTSAEEFPAEKKLKRPKKSISASHVEAPKVHVLCRLPKYARDLGKDLEEPVIAIELLDPATEQSVQVVPLDAPKALGKVYYISGVVDLPPSLNPERVRAAYHVRAVLISGDKTEPLATGAFTWHGVAAPAEVPEGAGDGEFEMN